MFKRQVLRPAVQYASDIAGGGPFHFEINGQVISDNIYAGNTGDWYNWLSGNTEILS